MLRIPKKRGRLNSRSRKILFKSVLIQRNLSFNNDLTSSTPEFSTRRLRSLSSHRNKNDYNFMPSLKNRSSKRTQSAQITFIKKSLYRSLLTPNNSKSKTVQKRKKKTQLIDKMSSRIISSQKSNLYKLEKYIKDNKAKFRKPSIENSFYLIEPRLLNKMISIAENCLKVKYACLICLGNIGQYSSGVRVLKCSHFLHRSCLRKFQEMDQSEVCPICRREAHIFRDTFLYSEYKTYFLKLCCRKIYSFLFRVSSRPKIHHFLSTRGISSDNEQYNSKMGCLTLLSQNLRVIRSDKAYFIRQQQKSILIRKEKLQETKNLIESINIDPYIFERNKIGNKVFEGLKKERDQFLERVGDDTDISEQNWKRVLKKTVIRGDKNCEICDFRLRNGRPTVVLQCSHVYHIFCLDNINRYSCENICPMCFVTIKERRMMFKFKEQ